MTRFEAELKLMGIFTATPAGLGSPLGFIAALEQLGLLKLDNPPADLVADFVAELQATTVPKISIRDVEFALTSTGLKIVEA
ncbi:hypothetical protein AB8A05_04105 [Tardiphaga sp. 538_B7_N1_4]|uniref:hypothetical protein n=1 Tax=Tardiphaga sp. 538_B7_N1_4 TaxID=3240778 RepID=UPI003F2788B8